MDYSVLLFQFYSFFVLMGMGYLAARLKIINDQNSGLLAGLVLNITLPILVFVSLTNVSFSLTILKNIGFTFLLSYLALFLLYIAGMGSLSFLKLETESRKVHLMHNMFGNIVFMGFPFLTSLFPNGEGLLYATIFQVANDSILYTWGILYLQKGKQKDTRTDLKHLLNPLSISFLISIVFILFGWKLQLNFEKPFSGLGHTTVYISLVYVGYLLSTIHFHRAVKKSSIIVLSFTKLLFVPILLMALLYGLQNFVIEIKTEVISAVVLQTAMPAMATVAMMAKKYNSDDVLASENIFVTTILSILTLPLIWYLLNLLFKMN